MKNFKFDILLQSSAQTTRLHIFWRKGAKHARHKDLWVAVSPECKVPVPFKFIIGRYLQCYPSTAHNGNVFKRNTNRTIKLPIRYVGYTGSLTLSKLQIRKTTFFTTFKRTLFIHTHWLSGVHVGTRWHKSLKMRMTTTQDWSPLALA